MGALDKVSQNIQKKTATNVLNFTESPHNSLDIMLQKVSYNSLDIMLQKVRTL